MKIVVTPSVAITGTDIASVRVSCAKVWRVGRLSEVVGDTLGVDPERLRLYHKGIPLDPNLTVGAVGIANGAELTSIIVKPPSESGLEISDHILFERPGGRPSSILLSSSSSSSHNSDNESFHFNLRHRLHSDGDPGASDGAHGATSTHRNGPIFLGVLLAHFQREGVLRRGQFNTILARARHVLAQEPAFIGPIYPGGVPTVHRAEGDGARSARGKLCVVGDLRGQLHDLATILRLGGGIDGGPFLFLGGLSGCMVASGGGPQDFSLETALFLLALKAERPSSVFLLRGHSETRAFCESPTLSTLKQRVVRRYGAGAFEALVDVFSELPIAAEVAEAGHRFLCVHGGLSPRIFSSVEMFGARGAARAGRDKASPPAAAGTGAGPLGKDIHGAAGVAGARKRAAVVGGGGGGGGGGGAGDDGDAGGNNRSTGSTSSSASSDSSTSMSSSDDAGPEWHGAAALASGAVGQGAVVAVDHSVYRGRHAHSKSYTGVCRDFVQCGLHADLERTDKARVLAAFRDAERTVRAERFIREGVPILSLRSISELAFSQLSASVLRGLERVVAQTGGSNARGRRRKLRKHQEGAHTTLGRFRSLLEVRTKGARGADGERGDDAAGNGPRAFGGRGGRPLELKAERLGGRGGEKGDAGEDMDDDGSGYDDGHENGGDEEDGPWGSAVPVRRGASSPGLPHGLLWDLAALKPQETAYDVVGGGRGAKRKGGKEGNRDGKGGKAASPAVRAAPMDVHSKTKYRLSFDESPRGKSIATMTHETVTRFLSHNAGFLTIIRAHDPHRTGYSLSRNGPFFRFPAVVSLFSAPDLAGVAKNAGAVLLIGGGRLELVPYAASPCPILHERGFANDVEAEDLRQLALHRFPDLAASVTRAELAEALRWSVPRPLRFVATHPESRDRRHCVVPRAPLLPSFSTGFAGAGAGAGSAALAGDSGSPRGRWARFKSRFSRKGAREGRDGAHGGDPLGPGTAPAELIVDTGIMSRPGHGGKRSHATAAASASSSAASAASASASASDGGGSGSPASDRAGTAPPLSAISVASDDGDTSSATSSWTSSGTSSLSSSSSSSSSGGGGMGGRSRKKKKGSKKGGEGGKRGRKGSKRRGGKEKKSRKKSRNKSRDRDRNKSRNRDRNKDRGKDMIKGSSSNTGKKKMDGRDPGRAGGGGANTNSTAGEDARPGPRGSPASAGGGAGGGATNAAATAAAGSESPAHVPEPATPAAMAIARSLNRSFRRITLANAKKREREAPREKRSRRPKASDEPVRGARSDDAAPDVRAASTSLASRARGGRAGRRDHASITSGRGRRANRGRRGAKRGSSDSNVSEDDEWYTDSADSGAWSGGRGGRRGRAIDSRSRAGRRRGQRDGGRDHDVIDVPAGPRHPGALSYFPRPRYLMRRDPWLVLARGIALVPDAARRARKAGKERAKRTESLLKWFADVDHFAKALLHLEVQDLCWDDEETVYSRQARRGRVEASTTGSTTGSYDYDDSRSDTSGSEDDSDSSSYTDSSYDYASSSDNDSGRRSDDFSAYTDD